MVWNPQTLLSDLFLPAERHRYSLHAGFARTILQNGLPTEITNEEDRVFQRARKGRSLEPAHLPKNSPSVVEAKFFRPYLASRILRGDRVTSPLCTDR